MILHCVFCQFKDEMSEDAKQNLLGGLAQLCSQLKGCVNFQYGPNRDFENKSAIYTDGFVITFESQATLETYAKHPRHKALGAELCALSKNGADGIIVFDLET